MRMSLVNSSNKKLLLLLINWICDMFKSTQNVCSVTISFFLSQHTKITMTDALTDQCMFIAQSLFQPDFLKL